jgi:hypothetical protein
VTRRKPRLWITLALVLVALVVVPAALAGKGGGGKPKLTSPTGSLGLVLLDSTDGLPHHGQNVTFAVSTTVMEPWVQLTCYQGGDWVTNQFVGFYAGYPASQEFPLASWKWTSGAADCDARLFDGASDKTIATISFHVDG